MTIKYKLIIIYILLTLTCSNSEYGVNGPDVIARHHAVKKIDDAYLVKFASCGFDATNVSFLARRFSRRNIQLLDGSYYSTRDVDFCVKQILFVSCKDSIVVSCNISSKDFFGGGGLLEGGF